MILRKIKTACLMPLRRNAQRHGIGSGVAARLCRFYLNWYENVDPDGATNGENALLRRLAMQKAKIVFDVGANKGDWTAEALAAFPQATIHLFEPLPALESALRSRFAGHANARINGVALSDRQGSAQISFDPAITEISSFHTVNGTGVPVRTTTGDAYCSEHGVDSIDLLKVDTEGHDLAVLRGFSRWIEAGRISLIQFEHNEASVHSRVLLKDFIDFLGPSYSLGKVMPFGVEPVLWSVQIERFRYGNYLAVRTGS